MVMIVMMAIEEAAAERLCVRDAQLGEKRSDHNSLYLLSSGVLGEPGRRRLPLSR
jgi:hypothetical protein